MRLQCICIAVVGEMFLLDFNSSSARLYEIIVAIDCVISFSVRRIGAEIPSYWKQKRKPEGLWYFGRKSPGAIVLKMARVSVFLKLILVNPGCSGRDATGETSAPVGT